VYEAFNYTRCALKAVSLAPRVDLEPKQKHAFVSEWMQ